MKPEAYNIMPFLHDCVLDIGFHWSTAFSHDLHPICPDNAPEKDGEDEVAYQNHLTTATQISQKLLIYLVKR